MKLTDETLREMIIQVMTELGLLMPYPLKAEPVGNEDPPPLNESNLSQKLYFLLSKISDKERSNLFRRFGYFTSNQLLSQLSSLKKAEKGDF